MTYQELAECFPIGTFWRHTSNPDTPIFHVRGFDCIKGTWVAVETDWSELRVDALKAHYRICDASVSSQPKVSAYVWQDEFTDEELSAKRATQRVYANAWYWRNKGVTAC